MLVFLSLFISWNFNFHYNFLEQEVEELAHLMFALAHLYLSPIIDARGLYLTSLESFSINSFLKAFFALTNLVPFVLANFVWKSKVP